MLRHSVAVPNRLKRLQYSTDLKSTSQVTPATPQSQRVSTQDELVTASPEESIDDATSDAQFHRKYLLLRLRLLRFRPSFSASSPGGPRVHGGTQIRICFRRGETAEQHDRLGISESARTTPPRRPFCVLLLFATDCDVVCARVSSSREITPSSSELLRVRQRRAAHMEGSTVAAIVLGAALLFIVVVAAIGALLYFRRKRRRHRVFIGGNIVEGGYSLHHGGFKGSNFHARPFTVSPLPEDLVEVPDEEEVLSKHSEFAQAPSTPCPPPSTEESTVDGDAEPQAPPRVFRLDVTDLVERHQEHHVQNFDETSVSIADFDASFDGLVADEKERLCREFKSLNRSFFGEQSTDEANHVENIKKNRYFNVLPYDFNRVKLLDGDYINASGIKAPNHHGVRYIAAQGPIGAEEAGRESTVAAFWRMIWERNVECVVMLTDCVERGKIKCAMYWPENAGEEITVEDMTINFYRVTEDEICFQRELLVTRARETRKVVQWHFKEWRDAEAPPNPEDFLDFVRAVRESRPCDPLLVHCSAGVGRSGVFVAVDQLLERVEDSETLCVNVFECVHSLRAQRREMVKNEEQYEAIYRTLLLAIRQRNQRVLGVVREDEISEIQI
uniref:Protein-tyrosine-phosphatase n=1 Tax=Steinernema glaseri TaxID=37863 RepID=A0A1I7ZCR0_9BILA